MICNPQALTVLAYENGFTQWHYKTKDPAVCGTGYFNEAHNLLRAGDMIIVNLIGDREENEIYFVDYVREKQVGVIKYGQETQESLERLKKAFGILIFWLFENPQQQTISFEEAVRLNNIMEGVDE